MPTLGRRWVEKRDIYYEDIVKIEAPFFAGNPPKPGMYLLKETPFSPVARWRDEEKSDGEPSSRKLVYCGGMDSWLQHDIEWLIHTARRRNSGSGFAFSPAIRTVTDKFDYPFPQTPADQAIRNALALTQANYSGKTPEFMTKTAFATGLGDAVDAIAARSPTLQKQLQKIDEAGWHIVYQRPGLASEADGKELVIRIGDAYRMRPEWAASQLSHELGHFEHPPIDSYNSKTAYLQAEQLSEGYATLSNITAQREIKANGGPTIPLSVSRENIAAYNAIYDQFIPQGDMRAAATEIGRVYADGEKSINPFTGEVQTYNQIYGGYYDANFKKGR